MRILIWGTGRIADNVIKDLKPGVEIMGIIDNDVNRQGTLFCGYQVYSPASLTTFEDYDYILIAVAQVAQEIYEQLTSVLSVDRNKILSLGHYWDKGLLDRNYDIIEKELGVQSSYTECGIRSTDLALIRKMEWDSFSDSVLKTFQAYIYEFDYTRYRTFELCADEILFSANPVLRGAAAAEVGVYRGDFAKIINSKLSQNKFYLFDTFSGFDETEYLNDREAEGVDSAYMNNFRDTSEDLVLAKMPHQEKCIIKKGFFPDSARGCEDEVFCFVSIDVDLFEPIYNSLEFFYPKLAVGGYLFIHEYNHGHYTGVKKAVRKYEETHGIVLRKIPIADKNGTAVIMK